jgi:hypothetical protein
MPKDKKYYHNKGEQDAANDRHNPPHQGPVFSKNWWEADMGGRPVINKDKQADYDAYEKGHRNTRKEKK